MDTTIKIVAFGLLVASFAGFFTKLRRLAIETRFDRPLRHSELFGDFMERISLQHQVGGLAHKRGHLTLQLVKGQMLHGDLFHTLLGDICQVGTESLNAVAFPCLAAVIAGDGVVDEAPQECTLR